MADWKPGDVVQLKSGGPKMTVESINEDGSCDCVWIDEKADSEARSYAYFPEVLRKAPSSHGGDDKVV